MANDLTQRETEDLLPYELVQVWVPDKKKLVLELHDTRKKIGAQQCYQVVWAMAKKNNPLALKVLRAINKYQVK